MNHLLQWLFDLHFIRITLSSASNSDSAMSTGDAYEALRSLLDRTEALVLSDAVDRLLYQEVLKASVRDHTQGVKILLAPFYRDNPLYGFRFQTSQSGGALAAKGQASKKDEAFDLQTTKHQPFRQVLPRFPMLPVAMGSSWTGGASSEFDARLGIGIDGAGSGRSASPTDAGRDAVSQLMQQGVSALGLGSLG